MRIPVFIVDTFTSAHCKGSPTAVCYMNGHLPTKHMLSITRELNFPVTAFVTHQTNDALSIRYFTPLTEITACGHATLGAAAVVQRIAGEKEFSFLTQMGTTLSVSCTNNVVSFTYPQYKMHEYAPNKALLKSLHIDSYKHVFFCEALETVFIELENPLRLKTIIPDFEQLLDCDDNIKEVVITCAADEAPYDYLLRSFCPWIGIDEDPATGSVHAALAPYWSARLGKTELRAFQASKRGGELWLFVDNNRVRIEGQCQFVVEGQLYLSAFASPNSVKAAAGLGIETA